MKVNVSIIALILCVTQSAIAQVTTPTLAPKSRLQQLGECEVFANADNQCKVFLNGDEILATQKYAQVATAKKVLHRGDVITVWAKNKEKGTRGGLCVTILQAGIPILTTKDFKYTPEPKQQDWKTSPSLTYFKEPDFYVGTYATVAGNKAPIMAWGKGDEQHTLQLYFKAVLK